MKRFFQLVIIFLVLFVCTLFFKQSNAYLILVTETQRRTTSLFFALVLLLVAFFVFYLLLRFLLGFINVRGSFRKWKKKRGLRSETDAITALLEGSVFEEETQTTARLEYWAEKTMDSRRAIELFCLLTHRMIALEQFDKAHAYLEKAKIISHQKDQLGQMCTLTEVCLLMAQDDMEQAEPLFASLRNSFAKKPTYILSKLKLLLHKQEFSSYFKLLDSLTKRSVLEKALLDELRDEGRLAQIAYLQELHDFERMYNKWSVDERSDVLLVSELARRLMDLSHYSLAEQVLEVCLNQAWNPYLLDIYIDVPTEADHKISQCEHWLKDHKESSALIVCLVKLLIQKELWGRATELLKEAMMTEPKPEYFELLAHIYFAQGQSVNACDLLNQSMLLRYGHLIEKDRLLSFEESNQTTEPLEVDWSEQAKASEQVIDDANHLGEEGLSREAALVRALQKSELKRSQAVAVDESSVVAEEASKQNDDK